MPERRVILKSALDSFASAAMIVASCVLVWTSLGGGRSQGQDAASPPLPDHPLEVGDAPVKGAVTAPVTMVVFSDFECPFCGRFAKDVLPQLEERYIKAEKLRVVFQNLPLTGIHKMAMKAAQMGECAHRQGRFWTLHDSLFAGGDKPLDEERLLRAAEESGLESAEMAECARRADIAESVTRDVSMARTLGITSTPTVFIGGPIEGGRINVSLTILGAKSVTDFASAIDGLITD